MGETPKDNPVPAPNGPQGASTAVVAPLFYDDPRDAVFATEHLKTDLKRSSTRGGMITMVGQGLRIFLTIASQFVLCRLVSPDDFGLFFMVTTLTAFAEIFKEMGLSMAVIQKEKVTHKEVTNVFWLNVAVGFLMMLMVACAAWPVASFYNRPELIPITISISVTFLLAGCTAQHRAILNRKMNYKALTINELDSLTIGILAAIGVGVLHKYGYVTHGWWALVTQLVVTAVAQAIGVWYLSPWRPSLPDKTTSIRSYVGFGANLTGFEILNYFARNVDKMLIGRVLGNDILGFYGNAYKLVLVPAWQINTPITRVAIPALSRLQNDPQKYRQYYVKSIGLLTFFGMPLVAAMTAMADKAIPVMLGPQWVQCVPIFLALAPAAFSSTFNVATGWVHSSLGRPDRQMKWGLVSSTVTVIGFFIAIAKWTVTIPGVGWTIDNAHTALPAHDQALARAFSVAVSFSITYCLVTLGPVAFLYCFRGTPLKYGHFIKSVWRQFVCAAVAGAITYAFLHTVERHVGVWYGKRLWMPFILGCVIHSVLYLTMFWHMPHGRTFMLEIVKLAENFRKKKAQPRGFPVEPTAGIVVPPSSIDPSSQDAERQGIETPTTV